MVLSNGLGAEIVALAGDQGGITYTVEFTLPDGRKFTQDGAYTPAVLTPAQAFLAAARTAIPQLRHADGAWAADQLQTAADAFEASLGALKVPGPA